MTDEGTTPSIVTAYPEIWEAIKRHRRACHNHGRAVQRRGNPPTDEQLNEVIHRLKQANDAGHALCVLIMETRNLEATETP